MQKFFPLMIFINILHSEFVNYQDSISLYKEIDGETACCAVPPNVTIPSSTLKAKKLFFSFHHHSTFNIPTLKLFHHQTAMENARNYYKTTICNMVLYIYFFLRYTLSNYCTQIYMFIFLNKKKTIQIFLHYFTNCFAILYTKNHATTNNMKLNKMRKRTR